MLGRRCFFKPHTPVLIVLTGIFHIAAASGNLLWAEIRASLENTVVTPEEYEAQQARLLAEERDLMEQISRQVKGNSVRELPPAPIQTAVPTITPPPKTIPLKKKEPEARPKPKVKKISQEKPKPTSMARTAPARKEVVVSASPLPAKSYEDSWRKKDQIQLPKSVNTAEIAKVSDLERTVGALRRENMQMRESFKELESRFEALYLAQAMREEPRARFAPSVEGLQENGESCSSLGCQGKLAATATVSADRVILRAGPTQVSMRITTLERGERLTVEMARGDWLRVVVAGGVRAWLPASAVVLD
ncbi:MAG: hypothetical protein GX589_02535 [Deltaproteobacteria bacterium]|nr:hypothetical protein [Deltaproteobacteria bacterium]